MKNRCLLKALVTVLGFLIPSMLFAGIDLIRVELSDSAERLNGRLYVVFSRSNEVEPRLAIGDDVVPARATPFFALDVDEWDGSAIDFIPSAGYPFDGVNELEERQWYVQALYDTDVILSEVNSPGAFYSAVTPVIIDSSDSELELELDQQIPAETLPEDTALLKFVKTRSDLLSEFYGTDVFLRASVLLPSSYSEGSDRRYPVLYHVAGMNGRYTWASSLLQMRISPNCFPIWRQTLP